MYSYTDYIQCFTYCNCFGKHLGDPYQEFSKEIIESDDESTDSGLGGELDPDTYDEFYGYDRGWDLREAGYHSGDDGVPYETAAERRFRLSRYYSMF
jgi:hypothetical protein